MSKHLLIMAGIAWKDSRGSRGRLLLYAAGLILAVAALVASLSIQKEVARIVELEARALLGADLAIRGKDEITLSVASDLPVEAHSRETRFRSMVTFGNGTVRLAQIRALEKQYPFYGAVQSEPEPAWQNLSGDKILLDEALFEQSGSKVGDLVKIGQATFKVAGSVTKIAGLSLMSAAVAPRIYMPHQSAQSTGLLTRYSIADHFLYLKLPAAAIGKAAAALKQKNIQGLTFETVDDQRRRLGNINENALLYFSLVAVACLALGGAGAGSCLYFYLRTKIRDAAILKCLGFTSRKVVTIFSLQLFFISLIACMIGGASGSVLLYAAIEPISSFFSTGLSFAVPWQALLYGVLVGVGATLLAAAPGLYFMREVPALVILRQTEMGGLPPVQKALFAALALLAPPLILQVFVSAQRGLMYGAVFDFAVILLVAFSSLTKKLVIRAARRKLPFTLRFGILNLERPQNATTPLIAAFSLTFCLAATLLISRHLILEQVALVESGNTANLFVYDVQQDQLPGVKAILSEHGLTVDEEVPIVLMRISRVAGRDASDILRDESSNIPKWTLRRDYWATYRSKLLANEDLAEGLWVPRMAPDDKVIPVSIEDRLAERLGVKVGSNLLFDVQGVTVSAKIASLRKIHWAQMRRNAFIVFPEGVLEEAPKFHFLTARAHDAKLSGTVQSALVRRFPGISTVDLKFATELVLSVLEKIAAGLGILASIVLFTSLAVLIATAASSSRARIRESSLLSVLGATRKQTRLVVLFEHLCLSLISAALGGFLALLNCFLLAIYVFHVKFTVPWSAVAMLGVASVLVICTTSLVAGALGPRRVPTLS